MKAEEMTFPVLQMNEHHIARLKSPTRLRKMPQRELYSKAYTKDAVFIDSSGNRYPLVSIRKRRRSWHILDIGARSTIYHVEVEVGEPTPMSLDEIKQAIMDLVVRKGWYNQGCQNATQFRAMVGDFQSIADVMNGISYYGKW